ncbi:MAG: DNA recombination protein RmuC [Actinomycetota bacterium]
MVWLAVAIAFCVGAAGGFLVAWLVRRHSEAERAAELEAVKCEMKDSFGSLSLDTLSKLTEEFSKLASGTLAADKELGARDLDAKKGLIDKQLEQMNTQLTSVSELVKTLEKDREKKFGELSSRLTEASAQTGALVEVTNTLNKALANTAARGQWGERMAEDVLRVGGFIEGINYAKQKQINGVGTRPDYTFFLPRELVLNMDVKFPLDNYMHCLGADSDREVQEFSKRFLGDVKLKIKEVAGRDYINPEQNTVDCVLLFIPNEQVYSFIQQHDSTVIDYGIENRVLLCSPVTLIAILSVIRQAVDNFAIAETSREMLGLFGQFRQQWGKFTSKMDELGQKIEQTQRKYVELTGTRRRQLEKPLEDIEELRQRCALPQGDEPGLISSDEKLVVLPPVDIDTASEGETD